MKNKKGFTLMEMMVVVLILAGLAAIAYPVYSKVIIKARVAEAFSLGEIVREAQQRYMVLHTNREYFPAFTSMHVSGGSRLIKSSGVEVANGSLKKDDYVVTIQDVEEDQNVQRVENGCIKIEYRKHDTDSVIFTIYMHVEDSRIGCTQGEGITGVCDTISSAEEGTINCQD